ncbi:MAG: hypothetical protein U0V70_02185 [Terriglobia bacterium]
MIYSEGDDGGHLTEEDVRRLLTIPIAIEAVEEAFRCSGSGQQETFSAGA